MNTCSMGSRTHDGQQCLWCGVISVWGLRSVSRVERESLLGGCPGHRTGCHCTGRAPPLEETGDRPEPEPHSVQQLGRRHSHTSAPGAAEHWPVDTGHVDTCRDSQPQGICQSEDEELRDSHCERYLKHCPLRSEFYLAAVGWLTVTRPSASDIIVIIVEWEWDTSINSEQWQCSTVKAEFPTFIDVSRLSGFKSITSPIEELERYIIQIKLLSVNPRWRCRSQVENLNDIETLKLTNFPPWTPRSPVGTWVTWWTTTETSPTSPSTRPRSSASAKMPGSFPTCRSVHFISIHFPLQLHSEHSHSFIRCKQAIHTVIEYPKFVHEHLGKPLGLYWTLSFADTNSGVRVNWGLRRKLHVLSQCGGRCCQHLYNETICVKC